jgi:HYR domain
MRTPVVRMAAALAVAGSLVGGLECGHVSAAANLAPVVKSGAVTVKYQDVYSIHFTASDPEGAALTVVTSPINDDWIGCDDGPATSFTCDYSSSRYYEPAPLPTQPFQRSITYSVSDGTTTASGTWTVTVLPPPVMEIVGRPTVTEGGQAVLRLNLSSNTFGSLLIPIHTTTVDTPDGVAISTTDMVIEVGDGATSAEIRIPVDDDALDEPTEYFTVSVNAEDAIPYRFVGGSNLVTILDNDGATPSDRTPPVVAAHRNIVVERGGSRPAWVPYTSPTAKDAVDGVVPALCSPPSMSIMPVGKTQVSCKATDAAGNAASTTFQVTVRTAKSNGFVIAIGGDRRCVASGQYAWLEAEGFTSGAKVTIQLQSSSLEVIRLQTVRADRRGRVRQIVRIPTASAGDGDIVLIGPAGNDDLVRMLPVKVAHSGSHHGGRFISVLRNRNCD